MPSDIVSGKMSSDIENIDWSVSSTAPLPNVVRFGSSSSSQSSQTSGDICRICHCESDPQNPLLTPCYCSGSLKYVHQTCLQQWLTASETNSCELCKFPFIMHTKIKPFNEWRSLDMSGIERRRLFCAVLFHCAAALCVIWSLCVLIERAAEEVKKGMIGWPFWTKLVVVTVGLTGGVVFMYIQCRQYLHLCHRWRARNRILLIQNAPEKIHPLPQSPILSRNQQNLQYNNNNNNTNNNNNNNSCSHYNNVGLQYNYNYYPMNAQITPNSNIPRNSDASIITTTTTNTNLNNNYNNNNSRPPLHGQIIANIEKNPLQYYERDWTLDDCSQSSFKPCPQSSGSMTPFHDSLQNIYENLQSQANAPVQTPMQTMMNTSMITHQQHMNNNFKTRNYSMEGNDGIHTVDDDHENVNAHGDDNDDVDDDLCTDNISGDQMPNNVMIQHKISNRSQKSHSCNSNINNNNNTNKPIDLNLFKINNGNLNTDSISTTTTMSSPATPAAPPNSAIFIENKDILNDSNEYSTTNKHNYYTNHHQQYPYHKSHTPHHNHHRHSTVYTPPEFNHNLDKLLGKDIRRYSDTKLLQYTDNYIPIFNVTSDTTSSSQQYHHPNYHNSHPHPHHHHYHHNHHHQQQQQQQPQQPLQHHHHQHPHQNYQELQQQQQPQQQQHSSHQYQQQSPDDINLQSQITDIIFETSCNNSFDPLEINIQEMLELDGKTQNKPSINNKLLITRSSLNNVSNNFLIANSNNSKNNNKNNDGTTTTTTTAESRSFFKSLPNLSASSENLLP